MDTIKQETTIVEKNGFLKKAWKSIVTGIVCALASFGITFGVNQEQLKDTVTKAEAQNAAIAAAQYSAEMVVEKINLISTAENKAEAVQSAIDATKVVIPSMFEAAKAVKNMCNDAKERIKEGIEEAKNVINETPTEAISVPATQPAVAGTVNEAVAVK